MPVLVLVLVLVLDACTPVHLDVHAYAYVFFFCKGFYVGYPVLVVLLKIHIKSLIFPITTTTPPTASHTPLFFSFTGAEVHVAPTLSYHVVVVVGLGGAGK